MGKLAGNVAYASIGLVSAPSCTSQPKLKKGTRPLATFKDLAVFEFEPELGLKRGQTNPKISGTVPTNRRATIPNDSAPISASFDDDPKLF